MKRVLFFLVFIGGVSGAGGSLTLSAQSRETGTATTCTAHWKKGDTKVFSILQTKHSQATGKPPSYLRLLYEAHLTVLDSSAGGYKLQWVFHLPPEFRQTYPLSGDSLPVYEGLKMIYRTDPSGVFTELLNWKEVREAYIRLVGMAAAGATGQAAGPVDRAGGQPGGSGDRTDSTAHLFETRQAVESNLIREIRLYHRPYGHRWAVDRPSQEGSELANPWSDTPLQATRTWKVIDFFPADPYFSLTVREEADTADRQMILKTLFAQLPAASDSAYSGLRQALARFSLRDDCEYRVYPSSGWITIVRSTRTMQVSELHEEEKFEIIQTE